MRLIKNKTRRRSSTVPVEKNQTSRQELFKKILKLTFLIFGVGFLAVFILNSDLDQIYKQLVNIGWNFVFVIGVTFLSYAIVTYAWKLCFIEAPKGTGLFKLFMVRQIGESIAQINPTNVLAGDTYKAYQLKRDNIPYTSSFPSVTISRFLIILSGIHLIAIWICITLLELIVPQHNIGIFIITFISFLLVGLLIPLLKDDNRGPIYHLLVFLKKRFPNSPRIEGIGKHLSKINDEYIQYFKSRKPQLFVAYLLSFLHRIIGALEFYVILSFSGVEITIMQCIYMEVGVSIFKALGSFVPGQIGVEEYGNKLMLDLVSVHDPTLWITVSIVKRTRLLFWLLIGLIGFIIYQIKNKIAKKSDKEYECGAVIYN